MTQPSQRQRPIRYKVGNRVVFGNGKVVYTIAAVIDTGRITTYDLHGPRNYVAVPHPKLNPAPVD